MNQAVQLLARGLQDVWLSGNPEVSFYRSTFKRYVQFGSSIEQFVVPDTGKIVINTKSDLLGYTYLTAHDTATGTLVPGVDWSNIISTVDLNIGNQIIATHDIVYINTIQKALESDAYSSRSQTNTFQPLGFFFDKQALPILALRYTDVRINITWVSAAASKQYVYKCWAHCIRLADEERQFFSTATHRILIPQMQRVMVSNEPNFHGPLKYIAAPCFNYANYIFAYLTPKAVTNLAVSGAAQTTVNLTWTGAPGATSYSIVSSPATTTQTTSNPSSYTFTGLLPATSYTFTVTSVNVNGTGGSVTSSSITTILAAVTNLAVSGATQTTVNLTWTGATGAASYSIVSSPATTTQTTSNPSSYTFTGLSPSTSYTFTVTSVNGIGTPGGSATSSSISTAAAAVSNLQALSTTATTADLTWTTAVGATSYSIVSSPATTTQTTSNPSSYTFTGLTDGTNYTVAVTPISPGGPGETVSATVFRNKVLGSASIVNNAPGGNTAISFPGTVGSYAQIDTRNASPIGNNLFIEAWVYFGTINATAQTIFSMGSASTEYMSIKVADAGGPDIAGPFTCSQTNGDGTVTTSSAINRSFLDNTLNYDPGTPGPWRDFFLPQPAQYWNFFQIQISISKQPGTPAMSRPESFVQADFEYETDGNWNSLGTVDLLNFGVTWPAGEYNTTYTWTFPFGVPAVKDRNNPTIQPLYRFRVNGYADIDGTFYDLSQLLYPAQFVPSGNYNDFRAQAGQYNHLAFTWSNDSKTLTSFCNGMWVKTENQTAAAPLFSSRSGVGASYAGTASPFNGYIRNLRIVQGGFPQEGSATDIYANPNFVPDQTFDAGTVPSYTNGGTNVYTLIPFPTP